jgi:replicative DNA helicase
MSRAGSNGKPVLSDLKDSGSIEQDADMVIFIHRPGMLGMSDDLSEAEILIAKNRSGQVGSIPMRYNGDLVRFEDVKPFFYESAINQTQTKDSPDITPPRQYNPFEEFSQNDFVQ